MAERLQMTLGEPDVDCTNEFIWAGDLGDSTVAARIMSRSGIPDEERIRTWGELNALTDETLASFGLSEVEVSDVRKLLEGKTFTPPVELGQLVGLRLVSPEITETAA